MSGSDRGGLWPDLLTLLGADPAHTELLAGEIESVLAADDPDLSELLDRANAASLASLVAALSTVASRLLESSDVASTGRLLRLSFLITWLTPVLSYHEIVLMIARAVDERGVGPRFASEDPAQQLARVHNFRGCVLAEQQHFDAAADHFTEAVALASDFVPAYCNLARMRIENGDFVGAREDCATALAIDPEYPVLHRTAKLVDTIEQMVARRGESSAESAAAFGILHHLRTYDRPALRHEYGGTLAELDDPFDIPELSPEPTVEELNHRGVMLARIGQLDDATAMFDAALKADADYLRVYCNRGIANYLAGRLDGALTDLSTYIRMHPTDTTGYEVRAKVHRARGGDAAAISDDHAAKLWADDIG